MDLLFDFVARNISSLSSATFNSIEAYLSVGQAKPVRSLYNPNAFVFYSPLKNCEGFPLHPLKNPYKNYLKTILKLSKNLTYAHLHPLTSVSFYIFYFL